jgi:hypothetical protein
MNVVMLILLIEVLAMFSIFIAWSIALIKSTKHKLNPEQWKILRWGNWIFIIGFLLLVVIPDILGQGYTPVSDPEALRGFRMSMDLGNITNGLQQLLYGFAVLIALCLMFIGVHFVRIARRNYGEIPEWVKYISNL